MPADRDQRAVARDQAARTIRALEKRLLAEIEKALDAVAEGFAREVAAAIAPEVLASLAALWDEQINGILTELEAVYDQSWATTSRRFIEEPPSTVPGLVDDYLRTARNRLGLVGDDLWQTARRELADGVEAGESIPELRRRLQDAFTADGTQLGESRAERIARTEVVSAWNSASQDSIHALPDEQRPRYKTWLATLDQRTRDAHWAVDGQTVPIDASFTVGGEQLSFPGDPNGSPGNVINCRCTSTFSSGDEPMGDEGRQFLTDEEIADLDRERPGRGDNDPAALAAASVVTTNSAAGRGPGAPNNGEPRTMTQMEAVVSTVTAGGHWTAADVAYRSEVPLPAVRTYLARAVETGRLQRVERGVYAAATTEVAWHTPYPTALAFEGRETGDGRIFAPDAIYWEGESWPLQWAEKMLHGHEGAELAGAITETTRLGDRIPGRGTLYVDTEAGGKLHALLERDAPIGVSVDLDDISIEVRANPDGEEDEPVEVLVASASVMQTGDGWRIVTRQAPELVAAGLTAAAGDGDDTEATEVIYSESAGETLARITRGRLRGATAVALAALSDAHIVLGDGPLEVPDEVSAAVTGDVDLPILDDREREWDGPAAASRVLEWAQRGDPGEEEVAGRLSRAFLWRDDQANPATLSAYSLGVVDVIDDELRIIPRAVFATAGGNGVDALGGVSEEDRDRLRARVCGLYTRLAETFDDEGLVCPWRRNDDAAEVEAAAVDELAMLALIPENPADLVVEGGDPAGELHVTLAFLGEAADLTSEAVQVARETAARVATEFGPVEAQVSGIGTLGSEDPVATVLLLNGDDMNRLREAVWAELGDYGWEAYAEQYQPWIPHLTVGYGVPAETVTLPERIRFAAVRLDVGPDKVDFPLGDGNDAPVEPMGDIEASAHQAMRAIPPQPAAWFGEPTETELPAGAGGVHYVDGRVYGWVAQAGVRHAVLGHTIESLGDLDLTHFLRASLDLDDGTMAKVGAMTMDVGHHRDGAECETAACQFDDTRTVSAIVTVGQNERGLWFSGAAAPWLSEWSHLVFLACQPSYHMQQARDGRWQLRAVLTVPVPAHSHPLLASVVTESNVALAASAAEAAAKAPADSRQQTRDRLTVEVQPVINWDHIDTSERGRRSLELLASAVVDEMERREQARAEAEQLRAQMAQLEADMLTDVMQGDQ